MRFALLSLSFVAFVMFPSFAIAADQGKVAYVDGILTINGHSIKAGARVHEGDTLETAVGSYADVVMQSGVRFRLYPKSKLTIPPKSKSNPFKLAWGSLLSVVNKGRPYSVTGRTAVAGVRGTTFFVTSDEQKRTYICACEGKLALHSASGKEMGFLEAKHHKAMALDDESQTDEPMLGHTDQEIEELEGR